MIRRSARGLLYAAVVLLVVLHQDLWFWDDPRIVLGLPVGLTYHVGYCLVAAALLAMLVRFAWPDRARADDDAEGGA